MNLTLSKQTLRRFILGRQGLWPGRRWAGKSGTAEALRTCEAVQIDPLNVVARSHDIVLWGRVVDYKPEHLHELTYHDRAFFDWGGTLFIYPMNELPYWRVVMKRKGEEPRWVGFAAKNGALLKEVLAEVRRRGPLGNRDFTGRAAVSSYRARKDSGLALYYWWIAGELMTHHRRNFERMYHLRKHVAPPQFNVRASVPEAERFFAHKALAFRGLASARSWRYEFAGTIERPVSKEEAQRRLKKMLDTGKSAAIQVEGQTDPWYALAEDVPLLEALSDGRAPDTWQPLGTTTEEEAVFLAPLEIVSARGRAGVLFDFDYIWEVYKPASARRWGYYTLPILYGDRLVARLDPKLDRANGTLVINGFWLEDHAPVKAAAFADALAKGLIRFARFVEARRVNASAINPARLRRHVQAAVKHALS